MTATPPAHPVGEPGPIDGYDDSQRIALTATLRDAPGQLRQALDGLTPEQLDTRYKNWTIRQIAHHIADSHIHSYIRFKWTLTEETPLIKAYEEGKWVLLDDCLEGEVGPSLSLLDGLHAKWVQLLESMSQEQFSRTFFHPQTAETVDLWTALNYYPWHGRHHTGQIVWLREQHGW